jgi:phosphoribosylaminoimidazolecarboxamide formyltransferase / IMP cyclohydrolase
MSDQTFPRRALLSVSEKEGIVKFAWRLKELDFTLVSTGGTAKTLRDGGLEVIDVSEVTGFPEMMDGRLKTLHPRIFGGILGRLPEDLEIMAEHGIHPFELVVVNLYPFAKTVSKPGATPDEIREQIDVGGPSMVRAAVKNFVHVGIVTSPVQYGMVADVLDASPRLSDAIRLHLADTAADMLMQDAIAVRHWFKCQKSPTSASA